MIDLLSIFFYKMKGLMQNWVNCTFLQCKLKHFMFTIMNLLLHSKAYSAGFVNDIDRVMCWHVRMSVYKTIAQTNHKSSMLLTWLSVLKVGKKRHNAYVYMTSGCVLISTLYVHEFKYCDEYGVSVLPKTLTGHSFTPNHNWTQFYTKP